MERPDLAAGGHAELVAQAKAQTFERPQGGRGVAARRQDPHVLHDRRLVEGRRSTSCRDARSAATSSRPARASPQTTMHRSARSARAPSPAGARPPRAGRGRGGSRARAPSPQRGPRPTPRPTARRRPRSPPGGSPHRRPRRRSRRRAAGRAGSARDPGGRRGQRRRASSTAAPGTPPRRTGGAAPARAPPSAPRVRAGLRRFRIRKASSSAPCLSRQPALHLWPSTSTLIVPQRWMRVLMAAERRPREPVAKGRALNPTPRQLSANGGPRTLGPGEGARPGERDEGGPDGDPWKREAAAGQGPADVPRLRRGDRRRLNGPALVPRLRGGRVGGVTTRPRRRYPTGRLVQHNPAMALTPSPAPSPPGGAVVGEDGLARCPWAGTHPLNLLYHDQEWGRPVPDERGLFERLWLEAFQSGLSWLTILRKRDAFSAAFAGFETATVAGYGPDDVERLLGDPGIVRNRGKIEATIAATRAPRSTCATAGTRGSTSSSGRTAPRPGRAPAELRRRPGADPRGRGAGQGGSSGPAFASSGRPRSTPGCRPAGWSTTTSRAATGGRRLGDRGGAVRAREPQMPRRGM